MSLPAVSKHLRVLERAGLIERRVDGRTHHCRLSAAPLSRVDEWMAYYRQFWDETLERFSDHLTRDTD